MVTEPPAPAHCIPVALGEEIADVDTAAGMATHANQRRQVVGWLREPRTPGEAARRRVVMWDLVPQGR